MQRATVSLPAAHPEAITRRRTTCCNLSLRMHDVPRPRFRLRVENPLALVPSGFWRKGFRREISSRGPCGPGGSVSARAGDDRKSSSGVWARSGANLECRKPGVSGRRPRATAERHAVSGRPGACLQPN